jgi:serine/threonine kinase 32
MQSKKANFDASVELEELLLEDNPLKAKQRKVNQDNLSPEMKQMEEQCVWCSTVKLSTRISPCFIRFIPYRLDARRESIGEGTATMTPPCLPFANLYPMQPGSTTI